MSDEVLVALNVFTITVNVLLIVLNLTTRREPAQATPPQPRPVAPIGLCDCADEFENLDAVAQAQHH